MREELKRKLDRLEGEIQSERIRTLSDGQSERKDIRIERWKFITAISVQALFVVALIILNWDRAGIAARGIWAHITRAGETKVPLMIDPAPKHRRRRHRAAPKPPPIFVPEAKTDDEKPDPSEGTP